MRILLERSEFKPDRADKNGGMPLSFSDQIGHDRIAKLPQDRENILPGYAASLQTAELLSLKLCKLSEPPSKRAPKV